MLAKLWPLGLAIVMVALPLLGPSIDHHFAERQPYHAHVIADAWHQHDYQDMHAHLIDGVSKGDLVLYSFEVSPAGPVIALLADSELERRMMPDADSALGVPALPKAILRSASVSPPQRPPRG